MYMQDVGQAMIAAGGINTACKCTSGPIQAVMDYVNGRTTYNFVNCMSSCPAGQFATKYWTGTANGVAVWDWMCCNNCPLGSKVATACMNWGYPDYLSCEYCPAGQYGGDGLACASCPVGTYSGSYGSSACVPCPAGQVPHDRSGTGNWYCDACEAGTYSPSGSACLACITGTYTASAGLSACAVCAAGKTSDAWHMSCVNCAAGTAGASGGICTSCVAGKFQASPGYSTCNDCALGKYTGTAGKTVCQTCTSPATTVGTGQMSCNGCVAGYYRNSAGACIVCAGSGLCTGFTYVSCVGGSASFACVACTAVASCSAGKQPTTCNGNGVSDQGCENCPAGTSKATSSAAACAACDVGTYQNQAGQQSCLPCSNGLGTTMRTEFWDYVGTGATSSACTVVCRAGAYRSGSSCVLCMATAGKYSTTDNAASCASCTNKPSLNAQYLVPPVWPLAAADTDPVPSFTGRSNECPWKCNAGFYRSSATSCAACPSGSYRTLAMPDDGCQPCGACPDMWISAPCTAVADSVCSVCSTVCSARQYKTGACGGTKNLQCAACTSKCPSAAQYYSLSAVTACDGTGTYDTVNASCTDCTRPEACPAGNYLPFACTGAGSSNPMCTACSSPIPRCTSLQYEGGCGGYNNTRCIAFQTCSAGSYLDEASQFSAGVCRRCTNCTAQGLSQILSCQNRSDAFCGGASCGSGKPCNVTYDSKGFCVQAVSACGVCPPGYGSDGVACRGCPRGFTCDRRGDVACVGECPPGVYVECQDGYAVCGASCSPTGVTSDMLVTRGTFIRATQDECTPYFTCRAGNFLRFYAQRTYECDPCAASGGWSYLRYTTPGSNSSNYRECDRSVSRYNATSKLCQYLQRLKATNAAGMYGSGSAFWSCGVGKTSESATAVTLADCVPCPSIPVYAYFTGKGCDWDCLGGSAVGSQCVPQPWSGLTYPLQPAGRSKSGVQLVVQASSYAGAADQRAYNGLPFPACSVAPNVTAGAASYAVVCMCNQSYLVFVNLTGPNVFTQQPSSAGLLIGGDPGYLEGFRSEALFEEQLYVTAIPGEDRRVLVLDRLNCVLREVVMYPGEYVTRSYLVYGVPRQCYGPGSLSDPRGQFSNWLGGRVSFLDALSVMEVHGPTRTVTDAGVAFPAGVDSIALLNESVLVLGAPGRYYFAQATTDACPAGFTSLRGGACDVPCLGGFVNPSGVCVPCLSWLSCGPGSEFVACTAFAQGYCRPCPAGSLSARQVYIVPGSCDASLLGWSPPCPADFYNSSSRLCLPCPPYSSSGDGVRCSCWDGFRLVNGTACVAQSLGGRRYAWMDFLARSEYACGAGAYLDGMNPRVCVACPSSKVGLDGVTCESCPALQAPALGSTLCVCVEPSSAAGDGTCRCPDGMSAAGGACAFCGVNEFGAGGVCWPCPAGTSSNAGSTQCVPCPDGWYRAQGMGACVGCGSGRVARNASYMSCVGCSKECGAGTYAARACSNGTGFDCVGCDGGLPDNAAWTSGCSYECGVGFYRVDGGCEACNQTECLAGFYRSDCTLVQDSECLPCSNATKPLYNSKWADGCSWACDDGFELVVRNYIVITLYDCLPS